MHDRHHEDPAHHEPHEKPNSPTAAASCCVCITPVGSNTDASPAPGVAGAVQRQGAPDLSDAAEGGAQPKGDPIHPCHNPHCAHPTSPQPPARNRPRKTDERKRTHLIASRFNDEERQALRDAAAACAMTPSGFLAHAALAAARDLTRTAAEVAGEREVIAELFSLRRHLAQIGNNLNQVARTLNSGADAPHAETVLQAVHRAAKRVDAFTQHRLDHQTRAA
ncbi:plasmid mobilization protein [Streptomyces turgidiscabies]|uniref:Uncharacterized protein (DUF1778 family) n=1 Tax=Streptomyces turgidiscabies TaxID=85558 RepID=A0ABU0RGD7_9ACTN|nr:uncharacterized protein (DUF1778 family) [Streptomyces turgidiscabies]